MLLRSIAKSGVVNEGFVWNHFSKIEAKLAAAKNPVMSSRVSMSEQNNGRICTAGNARLSRCSSRNVFRNGEIPMVAPIESSVTR